MTTYLLDRGCCALRHSLLCICIPMVSLKRLCVLSLPSSLRISENDSWWNISCILNFCGSFIKNNSRIPISEIVISILTAQEKLCKTAFSCELMFMLLHCILFTILTQFFIAFFWANMVNGTSPSSNKTPMFVVCFVLEYVGHVQKHVGYCVTNQKTSWKSRNIF